MKQSVLSVRIAGKKFGDKPVLGPLELDLAAGDRLGILGPSGVGKTTLLRLVAGLDNRFDGTVRRPARIAMVFQEPVLLPWRSAIDNIRLTTGADEATAKRHMEAVGLAGRDQDFPVNFSLGQQRRLSLARALAAAPELLILDEPFASLDETTADQMIRLTRDLIALENITTLFVTHSRSEAERLVRTTMTLSGTPAALSAD